MGLPLENWERYARLLHGAVYREKGSARELAWLRRPAASQPPETAPPSPLGT